MEIFLQSSSTESNNKKFLDEAAQIRQSCRSEHGEKPLVQCPPCFDMLLEAARARYLNPSKYEWFASLRSFQQDIDAMITEAKDYRLDPRAIDDKIRLERSRWYAENARGSLLRLMVEDPAQRELILEQLEEPPSDMTGFAKEIGALLRKELQQELGGLEATETAGSLEASGIADRLAAAKDSDARKEVLKEAFFGNGGAGDTSLSENRQKYFDMIKNDNQTLDQVIDRILEERQLCMAARDQTEKLNSRLDELKRARAAHELVKARKAKERENSAGNKAVPEELYNLPPCDVCRQVPSTKDFLCCPFCIIFTGRDVQEQNTVYCTAECREKGYQSHIETHHLCSSGKKCISLHDEDTIVVESSVNSSGPHFCSECLDSIKRPTLWCSLSCADINFQRHREEVHIPGRKKLGMVIDDEDQLSYDNLVIIDNQLREPSQPTYHAKDIGSLTIAYKKAIQQWQEKNLVDLGF